jgi:large subunit ribosomal protein L18
MESSVQDKATQKQRRALRVRSKVRGSASKPRLCVVKTNAHIHVQLIDDDAGNTIASTSTLSKEFRSTELNHRCKAAAEKLGTRIAELALEKNVSRVVFDRGSSKYHGVIAALADAARAAGLQF